MQLIANLFRILGYKDAAIVGEIIHLTSLGRNIVVTAHNDEREDKSWLNIVMTVANVEDTRSDDMVTGMSRSRLVLSQTLNDKFLDKVDVWNGAIHLSWKNYGNFDMQQASMAISRMNEFARELATDLGEELLGIGYRVEVLGDAEAEEPKRFPFNPKASTGLGIIDKFEFDFPPLKNPLCTCGKLGCPICNPPRIYDKPKFEMPKLSSCPFCKGMDPDCTSCSMGDKGIIELHKEPFYSDFKKKCPSCGYELLKDGNCPNCTGKIDLEKPVINKTEYCKRCGIKMSDKGICPICFKPNL